MKGSAHQLVSRGRKAFQNRDYVAALANFREALQDHPEFADVHNLAGLCLSFMGQPENALDAFDRALALNPAYVEAHLNRAVTLNEVGRYDDARQAFERACRHEVEAGDRFPAAASARLANAHLAVGDLYLDADAPDLAVEQFRTALSLRPSFHDVRNRMGEALMQLGRNEEAREQFETALQGNPRFVAARLNLGLLFYHQGDLEKARLHWRHALQQAPGSPQARAYLSLVDRGPAEPARGS